MVQIRHMVVFTIHLKYVNESKKIELKSKIDTVHSSNNSTAKKTTLEIGTLAVLLALFRSFF